MSVVKRKTWCAESMKKAVEAVQKKEMGYLKASKTFNVRNNIIIMCLGILLMHISLCKVIKPPKFNFIGSQNNNRKVC